MSVPKIRKVTKTLSLETLSLSTLRATGVQEPDLTSITLTAAAANEKSYS